MKLNESIMKNLKESADNDRIVKVRIDYADDSIELTEENIKKEIKKYLPNARIVVIPSKNGRWPEVEITDKYSNLKSYISDIYLGGFDEDRDIDDFLVESVSRNSRKVSKNVNARRIKESVNLTACGEIKGGNNMKNLSESILHELNRQDIMSNQNVIDIINSYSSRKNHLKYKIKGNQAEFEDGTIIKFTLNGDDEIEYYTINSQGDTSKTALVHDFSLLDNLTESANVDVNNLTKEQLWKLRQEIVLGSLYTHDYDNSFGIDPSAVCSFFDSFIEDSQVDDFGKPIDREVEEYDNAEDLYNYYRSCENPFGEIESINESSKLARYN